MEIESIAKAVGALTTIAGFLFGLWQYTKAQRWKRAEFAANQLEKLTTDPLLSMACTLLDWSGRTLKIPESIKYKAGADTFDHDWDIIEKAMVPELNPIDGREGFAWQGCYIEIFLTISSLILIC